MQSSDLANANKLLEIRNGRENGEQREREEKRKMKFSESPYDAVSPFKSPSPIYARLYHFITALSQS